MIDKVDWQERLTVHKERMTTVSVRPSMRSTFKEIMKLNGFENYEELFQAFIRTTSLKTIGGAK